MLATSDRAESLLGRPRQDIPCTDVVSKRQGRTPERGRPESPGDRGLRGGNVIKG